MYNYDEIREVHLEVTNKCNASCPMCSRNKNGGAVNQWLSLVDLSLAECKTIFPGDFLRQLDNIFMCGNYGDPIMARDTLEIYDYFRSENPNVRLGMNTNGSARKPDWWHDLATTFGSNGAIIFGLDGLSDTNHLYRKGTNFEKVIENAEAFINAGGQALWDFIVFKHNEHQIEEAREFAMKMGFKQFRIKKTGRFFKNATGEPNPRREVWDNDGNVVYYLEQPSIEYQNQSILDVEQINEDYGSMKNYLDKTEIKCKVLPVEGSSIYVSADGNVFPCCWIGTQTSIWSLPKETGEIWNLIKATGGINKLNAKYIPIEEIVVGDFFQAVKESWSLDSMEAGKLKICASTCGQRLNRYEDQYK